MTGALTVTPASAAESNLCPSATDEESALNVAPLGAVCVGDAVAPPDEPPPPPPPPPPPAALATPAAGGVAELAVNCGCSGFGAENVF